MKDVRYLGKDCPAHLTWKVLENAHSKFLKEEPRDAIYIISSKLVKENWNNLRELSSTLGVLLSIWNSTFYRYGILDYELIQKSLIRHKKKLDQFRHRRISSLMENEKVSIEAIYVDFLLSLAAKGRNGRKNEGKVVYSPVSTGKALHLLCPDFFPLWDDNIAISYGCKWNSTKTSFHSYWRFLMICKKQVLALNVPEEVSRKPTEIGLLKLIDEFNYLCFTKKDHPEGK